MDAAGKNVFTRGNGLYAKVAQRVGRDNGRDRVCKSVEDAELFGKAQNEQE